MEAPQQSLEGSGIFWDLKEGLELAGHTVGDGTHGLRSPGVKAAHSMFKS